jgi:hypothetical protein
MLKEYVPSRGYRHHDAYEFRDLKPELEFAEILYASGVDLLAVPSVKIVGYIGAIKK